MNNQSNVYEAGSPELEDNNTQFNRKTLSTVTDQEGEITRLDNTNFGIKLPGSPQPLLPVNLPASLQKPGLKVKFSGELKEMSPTEFWAGQPLVLTAVREK